MRQKLFIPSTNCSLFIGFTSLHKCFNSCHTSSMGFRSGLSGGDYQLGGILVFCHLASMFGVIWKKSMMIRVEFLHKQFVVQKASKYSNIRYTRFRDTSPNMYFQRMLRCAFQFCRFPPSVEGYTSTTLQSNSTVICKGDFFKILGILKTAVAVLKSFGPVHFSDKLAVFSAGGKPTQLSSDAFNFWNW